MGVFEVVMLLKVYFVVLNGSVPSEKKWSRIASWVNTNIIPRDRAASIRLAYRRQPTVQRLALNHHSVFRRPEHLLLIKPRSSRRLNRFLMPTDNITIRMFCSDVQ